MKKVEDTITINTKSVNIISAFTDQQHLKAWWNVERSFIDTKPGGLYTLLCNISEKGIGYISTGILIEYDKNKILYIENFVYLNPAKPVFGPMELLIKAEEKYNQTELYLCQSGYQTGNDWDWYYEAVKQAWPNALKTLKQYIEKD